MTDRPQHIKSVRSLTGLLRDELLKHFEEALHDECTLDACSSDRAVSSRGSGHPWGVKKLDLQWGG